jgi:hypothetical protein
MQREQRAGLRDQLTRVLTSAAGMVADGEQSVDER